MRFGKVALAGALVAAGVGACSWLLPERFAVNAPVAHMLFGRGVEPPPEEIVRQRMRGPEGYGVGLFAEGIRGARLLRFTSGGDLLVSTPGSGSIWSVSPDRDGDGRSDRVRPLLENLARPHGLEIRDGWLYVGEADRVRRIRIDEAAGSVSGALEDVVVGLPEGGNHWSRTLRIGPDDKLYVSVGSSCNVCIEEDDRRAALLRYELDGSGYELYATGLRNAVSFDWQPGTNELYATDNGRDLLGDDFPPCELNRVVRGGFYGWPFANGDRVPDPDFGTGREREIAASIPPAFAFRAHNAPLGIHFVGGQAAPAEYRGSALVALHGSWNRTRKDGYKVVSLHWDAQGRIEERDFLTGFEFEEDVTGRPVDAAVGPDGAFYVSDDYAGAIWRVAPAGSGAFAPAGGAARDPSGAPSTLSAEDQRRAPAGAALYATHACGSCHDAQQAAQGVVPVELADLRARYSVDELAAFFVAPTPPMPAFPLTADERRDLAAFLLGREAAGARD